MGTINNSDTINEANIALGIQSATEKPIQSYNGSIVPVVEVNPKMLRGISYVVGASTGSTSGTSNILTAATDRDTYIHQLHISYYKDATCDRASGSFSITLIPYGTATAITVAAISLLTLTAQQYDKNITFDPPIRIKRGSIVQGAADTYTVGSRVRDLRVLYSEDDPN